MKRSGEVESDTIKDAKSIFEEFVSGVTIKESKDEIRSVALIVLEKLLRIESTDVMAGKRIAITEAIHAALQEALKRINSGEPVQYVVEEAFFFGRTFIVNPSVLIPRPETEELVRAALSSGSEMSKPRVVDIGTGSGCIPVTVALALKEAEVFATDISTAALAVARRNAERHGASVTFIEHNILEERMPIGDVDIIVSNPPYVTLQEAHQMAGNVKDFEPHLALFVPDDDPLLFYRAIIQQAVYALRPDGFLAVEINEKYGLEVAQLFVAAGFKEVQVLTDVPGKQRVVQGRKER